MEKWTTVSCIPGYEKFERYEVSDEGKVRHLQKNGEYRDLKPRYNNKGYDQVQMYNTDGEVKNILTHRLVAAAYVYNPDPENSILVNHIDENPKNNYYANLEWCDWSYNLSYNDVRKKSSINECKAVRCTDTGEEFYGVHEAARQMNLNPSSISAVCLGKHQRTGGYHFEYVDKENKA